MEAVMARSLQDVQPADLQIDMDSAMAWSRDDWVETELERQQRLLQEAAERRGVICLDDSDDEAPPPPCSHIGDPGQGSSRQVPPPQDDSTHGSTAISACRTSFFFMF